MPDPQTAPIKLAMPESATVAAVDLGSNSFHMIVGRLDNGELKVIDRLRETVRLGEGLLPDHTIEDTVRQRSLDCLSRFGQRLAALPPGTVRAVGTNTLRQVRDGGRFVREAEAALGHPIEIIAGREEARLIYLGVAHGLAGRNERRLVVDIGGGSTELIIGKGLIPLERESLFMGCLNMTKRFFADQQITQAAMDRAVMAARLEVRPIKAWFRSTEWQTAVGSSGTIKAIGRVLAAQGWCDQGISRAGLKQLRRALVEFGRFDAIQLDGMSDDRRPVFAGGVAVLSGVFKSLDIELMQVSDLALREGLLYEVAGYIQHHDVRDHAVDALVKRYQIDKDQANRVKNTALGLLRQVAASWQLDEPDDAAMLGWAARLHEVGLTVSHSGFHKHGAYLLSNGDLPGFSRQDQAELSALVRDHRRKLTLPVFEELPAYRRTDALRLCLLLRLAVLMHRGRSITSKPEVRITVDGQQVDLQFPRDWLEEHPLTVAELEAERSYLSAAGFVLNFQ